MRSVGGDTLVNLAQSGADAYHHTMNFLGLEESSPEDELLVVPEDSARVRTVLLVLAEAARLRAAAVGGAVRVVVRPVGGLCERCSRPLYEGQTVVETTWRPVAMGQVRSALDPVVFRECSACALERVLSDRRPELS